MSVAAYCPGCGAPLSETSVLALAPVCIHCGVVITTIGGTLGLTGVYGVADKSITRRRLEADLAVLQEYQVKYEGMKQACIEQLQWGPERYANLPRPPELLTLQPVPPLWADEGPLFELGQILFVWVYFGLPGLLVSWIVSYASELWGLIARVLLGLILLGLSAQMIRETVTPHFRAITANGERPAENARRQETYDRALAAAIHAAEPVKAAQDHRLRLQIRELESQASMVMKKEADVRVLLASVN